jgi:hypothetical protein
MTDEPEFIREQRRAFVKWWFDFIERFLMVGALGVAYHVSKSLLLYGLYLLSMILWAGWTVDSLRSWLATAFPRETRPQRLQRFWPALGVVGQLVLGSALFFAAYILVYQLVAEFERSTR